MVPVSKTVRVVVIAAMTVALIACQSSQAQPSKNEGNDGSSAGSTSQPSRSATPAAPKKSKPDGLVKALSSTIVILYGPDGTALGTAFVVGYPMKKDPSKVFPLLVTAKHVVNGQTTVRGRFTAKRGSPSMTVEQTYDLSQLRKSGDVWEHSNGGVDLIVFRIRAPQSAEFTPIPLGLIASKEMFSAEDIKETDRVVFPSLLVGLVGLSRDYPVVRDGSVALLLAEPISVNGTPKADYIFLNAAANQGSSGAPVFLWPGPRLKNGAFTVGGTMPLLLCVIDGFFNSVPRNVVAFDPQTRQTSPAMGQVAGTPPRSIPLVFAEDSRVGFCSPAWNLREILDGPALEARLLKLESTP